MLIPPERLDAKTRAVYPNGVDPHNGKQVGVDGITLKAFTEGSVTVDKLLDYVDLKLDWYVPSDFTIEFMIFIRLVLGEEPENTSPKAHYFFIDCIFQQPNVKPFFMARGINFDELSDRVIILASREFSKSTLVTYLFLYMAAKGSVPGFGRVNYGIYISDSMRNNVATTMDTIRKVYMESKYLKSLFEETRLVQHEVNFIRKPSTKKELDAYHQAVNVEGLKPTEVPGRMKRTFTLVGLGAAALPLSARLFGEHSDTTIGEVKIGEKIYGPDGKLATVTEKSVIFNRPMHRITLKDGRYIDVTDDHINSVLVKNGYRNSSKKITYDALDITTSELIKMPLAFSRVRASGRVTSESLLWIKNTSALEFNHKKFNIDPYTLGLLLGDGSFKSNSMNYLHMEKQDFDAIVQYIPYDIGTIYADKRSNVISANIKSISDGVRSLGLVGVTCKNKFIPDEYFRGSIQQRLDMLRGLMDSDGSAYANGRMKFTSISEKLSDGVAALVRSLGGTAFKSARQNPVRKKDGSARSLTYLVEISISERIFNLPRKIERQNYNRKADSKVQIISIVEIDSVPSQCIAIDNYDRQYLTGEYFRTHNTGGRGSRDGLARPDFTVFDDMLPSEKDANSDVIIEAVESTIEADILPGMNNNANFSIMIGTPYSKKDCVYRRIEQGTWLPVVFPRAETVPSGTEDEFVSVWPDRHSYKNCKRDYKKAMMAKDAGDNGPIRRLMQEHYLRISNDEDRMISDKMINWYSRAKLMSKLEQYNLYMTTDFTTTGNAGSDLSGTALWALGSNNDWFLLDLSLRKKELTEQYDDVFVMVNTWSRYNYRGVTVGVEVDGGQRAHIQALKDRMVQKNTWFTIGKQRDSKPGSEGIMSRLEGGNKHWRFRLSLPLFQNHKIWFPEELRETPDMKELIEELEYVTYNGIGSRHDDGLDLISMILPLESITPPAVFDDEELDSVPLKKRGGMWAHHDMQYDEGEDNGAYSTYM